MAATAIATARKRGGDTAAPRRRSRPTDPPLRVVPTAAKGNGQAKVPILKDALSRRYATCRTWGHVWDTSQAQLVPPTERPPSGSNNVIGMIAPCLGCSSQVVLWVNRITGQRYPRTYHYADGYLHKRNKNDDVDVAPSLEQWRLTYFDTAGFLKKR